MNIPQSDLIGNKIIRTRSATITRVGGTVRDPESGLAVTFLPDSVLEPVTATLTITARQLPSVVRERYKHAPNGVVLTFDASKLSQTPHLEIGLPARAFGERTVLAVVDPSGRHWPIPTPHRKGSSRRVGDLPVGFFLRGERSAAPAVPNDPAYSLRIFTATPVPVVEPLETYVAVFDPPRQRWNREVIPSLAGKRVAVVVHGVMSSLEDLIYLANLLATYTAPGGEARYYDYVIGFNYSSTAPIADIGYAMMASVTPVIADARASDLVAHSMGNLVARWAMEVGRNGRRLGSIGHYVSLGGPHAGVPFGAWWLVDEFLYLFDPACKPCLEDLLTAGYHGQPNTGLLPSINTNTPNPSGTRYYSLAGTNYEGYRPSELPVGMTTHEMYLRTCGSGSWNQWHLDTEDGLVAIWSAQSPILGVKDPQWKLEAQFTARWTHTDLHDAPAARAIQSVITTWAVTDGNSDTRASATAV